MKTFSGSYIQWLVCFKILARSGCKRHWLNT